VRFPWRSGKTAQVSVDNPGGEGESKQENDIIVGCNRIGGMALRFEMADGSLSILR
jgi:hypothetical protein